jgi:hypothetical protein
MWENLKVSLLLLCIVIVFFLVAPHILNFTGSLTSKPRVLVEYPTAVQGRITGSEIKRQHHLYYLDGNTEQYYDFNGFAQPLPQPKGGWMRKSNILWA